MAAASRESFGRGLQGLVRKFEADRDHYLSRTYPEAQARVDFITPFFKALGWDVDNAMRQAALILKRIGKRWPAERHGTDPGRLGRGRIRGLRPSRPFASYEGIS